MKVHKGYHECLLKVGPTHECISALKIGGPHNQFQHLGIVTFRHLKQLGVGQGAASNFLHFLIFT